ncbi:hypothetical protein ACSAZL_09165 [Methanosarcina sp. T3]|uniref:hypothetical protein n=1 Tax=Methanosarcina sp. T3 TaxID=3439062 RepID=UPI003F852633
MSEVSDFKLQISLLERSETDRALQSRNSAETDRALQSRNSAETDLVLQRRNSGCRAATLLAQPEAIVLHFYACCDANVYDA